MNDILVHLIKRNPICLKVDDTKNVQGMQVISMTACEPKALSQVLHNETITGERKPSLEKVTRLQVTSFRIHPVFGTSFRANCLLR